MHGLKHDLPGAFLHPACEQFPPSSYLLSTKIDIPGIDRRFIATLASNRRTVRGYSRGRRRPTIDRREKITVHQIIQSKDRWKARRSREQETAMLQQSSSAATLSAP